MTKKWIAALVLAAILCAAGCALSEGGGFYPVSGGAAADPWDEIFGAAQDDGEALEVLFPDPAMRAAVEAAAREALHQPDAAITEADLAVVTELNLEAQWISDAGPLSLLTGLERLNLSGNALSDVSALSDLKELTFLDLSNNLLVDVWPLEKLSRLQELFLSGNLIVDTSPLWALKERGCYIVLRGNPTTSVLETAPAGVPAFQPSQTPSANSPYVFQDRALEQVVRSALGKWQGPLYLSDLEQLFYIGQKGGSTEHEAWRKGIHSIEDLRYCVNLRELDLSKNQISDISPLTGLQHLYRLSVSGNNVRDLSPLKSLTALEELSVSENDGVTTIEPLSGLYSLRTLYMNGTSAKDISPIMHLDLEMIQWSTGKIPKADRQQFKVLHPGCKISDK